MEKTKIKLQNISSKEEKNAFNTRQKNIYLIIIIHMIFTDI